MCELGAGAFFYARKTKRTSRERGIVSSDDCWCATGTTTTTTTIGVRASSINQSIDSKKKKKRVASSSIKSHLSPVGKTHPADSLTTVFSSASASQPRPRSLPPPLVGHSHRRRPRRRRFSSSSVVRRFFTEERRLLERRLETCEKTPSLRTNDVFSSLLFFPPFFFFCLERLFDIFCLQNEK